MTQHSAPSSPAASAHEALQNLHESGKAVADAALAPLRALSGALRGSDRPDTRLLEAVALHPKAHIGDLAQRLSRDASSVSRQVRRLADRGLVSYVADGKDLRARAVEVTDAGKALLSSSLEKQHDVLLRAAERAGWSEDRVERFLHDASELVAGFDADVRESVTAHAARRTEELGSSLADVFDEVASALRTGTARAVSSPAAKKAPAKKAPAKKAPAKKAPAAGKKSVTKP